MSSLCCFDLWLRAPSGVGRSCRCTALPLPILTICIIGISIEASGAKHLMIDCIRSKRRSWCLTAGMFVQMYSLVGQQMKGSQGCLSVCWLENSVRGKDDLWPLIP